jgi:hypothetical protein
MQNTANKGFKSYKKFSYSRYYTHRTDENGEDVMTECDRKTCFDTGGNPKIQVAYWGYDTEASYTVRFEFTPRGRELSSAMMRSVWRRDDYLHGKNDTAPASYDGYTEEQETLPDETAGLEQLGENSAFMAFLANGLTADEFALTEAVYFNGHNVHSFAESVWDEQCGVTFAALVKRYQRLFLKLPAKLELLLKKWDGE